MLRVGRRQRGQPQRADAGGLLELRVRQGRPPADAGGTSRSRRAGAVTRRRRTAADRIAWSRTRSWREQVAATRRSRTWSTSTAPDGSLDAPLQYIDLRLGNTCNMQCVMCQPRESSRWLPTARRLSELCAGPGAEGDAGASSRASTPSRFEWYRNPEFWSNLETFLPHVKELILAGGEPFLIKEQFAFVKACCEAGEAGHIRLRYHTNGSVFPGGDGPVLGAVRAGPLHGQHRRRRRGGRLRPPSVELGGDRRQRPPLRRPAARTR